MILKLKDEHAHRVKGFWCPHNFVRIVDYLCSYPMITDKVEEISYAINRQLQILTFHLAMLKNATQSPLMFSPIAGFPWPGLLYIGRGGGIVGESYGETSWVRTTLFGLFPPFIKLHPSSL